jgi:hypothetical protein
LTPPPRVGGIAGGTTGGRLRGSIVTFGGGRTNTLPGFVRLALFAIFVFLVFVP